ncbi:hypothetical protein Q9L42_020325 (plasmid) [Methylomarinum sp. Ch1-1]|uniref:Uncharacterized protein n=1 Tax=Methylomarinum roseum TaxID=3067653 RepID=A0AAU7P088_9GAMM
MKYDVGEVFVPGQVWVTSRGGLWKILRYEYRNNEKFVLMRAGEEGRGRKQYRPWDKVDGWSIWIHADGTPTANCVANRESYK